MHAIDDVPRKIDLRNRDVTVNKGSFNQNQPSSSQPNTEKKNERQKDPIVYKESENKVEQTVSTLNLQIKLSKLKISIPFNELLKNREYRD